MKKAIAHCGQSPFSDNIVFCCFALVAIVFTKPVCLQCVVHIFVSFSSILHRLQIHPVGAFLRLIVIHREEGSYSFQSILSNIVKFRCVKAATLIEPQIFLGYIRIKNQDIIRIDCYIDSTAVKVSNGMRP